jgi:hypothetical protein
VVKASSGAPHPGGADAAYAHGHLQLLELLRHVRHVGGAHLVPERGEKLVDLLLLLRRRRHHLVLVVVVGD